MAWAATFAVISFTLVTQMARAAAAETIVPSDAYTHAHQLVAVDGSRRLNLFCLGIGKPTVVLEMGLGSSLSDWRQVQAAIAKITQVCAYDRAGYGFSDPPRRASDVDNTVDDLHRLVAAATIAKPFVLVGHSKGGLYAISYASRYPTDVAAMVLIDPALAGQASDMAKQLLPAEKAENVAQRDMQFAEVARCGEMAKNGEFQKPEGLKSECLDNPPNPDAVLHQALNAEFSKAGKWQAMLSETQNITATDLTAPTKDDIEARSITFDFNDKPLIVLSAGDEQRGPTITEATQDRIFALRKNRINGLTAKSRRGTSIVVPKSGHDIQNDQPGAVIDAVRTVVTEAHDVSKRSGG
jgi:pimeloyl-ACP methyl ester carboxylesterase